MCARKYKQEKKIDYWGGAEGSKEAVQYEHTSLHFSILMLDQVLRHEIVTYNGLLFEVALLM